MTNVLFCGVGLKGEEGVSDMKGSGVCVCVFVCVCVTSTFPHAYVRDTVLQENERERCIYFVVEIQACREVPSKPKMWLESNALFTQLPNLLNLTL